MKKTIAPVLPAGVCLIAIILFCACTPSEPAADAEALLSVSLVDLDNQMIDLAEYKGRVIMYNLWATWCGPCREEIPDFIDLQRRYETDGLVILGVSLDEESIDTVRRFVSQKKINYPVFYAGDRGETVTKKIGGFRGIPTTLLIDREGRIVKKVVGMASKKQWIKAVENLL